MSGYMVDPSTQGVYMSKLMTLAEVMLKLNAVRQVITTISERPAAKTSGERAMFIAYRETSWLKKELKAIYESVDANAAAYGELIAKVAAAYGELIAEVDSAIQTMNDSSETFKKVEQVLDSSGIAADDDRNRSL